MDVQDRRLAIAAAVLEHRPATNEDRAIELMHRVAAFVERGGGIDRPPNKRLRVTKGDADAGAPSTIAGSDDARVGDQAVKPAEPAGTAVSGNGAEPAILGDAVGCPAPADAAVGTGDALSAMGRAVVTLWSLKRDQWCNQRDLGEALDLDGPATRALVENLVKEGLVERVAAGGPIRVRLTLKGVQIGGGGGHHGRT